MSDHLLEPRHKALTLADVTAVLANEDPVKIHDTYGIDVVNLTEDDVERHQDTFKRILRRCGE